MVLVPVRDHNRAYFVLVFNQIAEIRNDNINPQHFVIRKCQTRIQHHNIVSITEYRHVFTDLPQTSQGDDLQFFFRQNKTSQYKYVPNSLADLAMDNQNCPVRSQTSVLIITY